MTDHDADPPPIAHTGRPDTRLGGWMSTERDANGMPLPAIDEAAELHVLGTALESPTGLDAVRRLPADRFAPGARRDVYDAVIALDGHGAPVTPETVLDELTRRGRRSVGPLLLTLQQSAVPAPALDYWIGRLDAAAESRRMLATAQRLIQLSTMEPGDERRAAASKALDSIHGGQINGAVMVTYRMSDVEPERINWLWPGRLARGKLHIVDGDPGRGKSTIGYDLAARLSTGSPWPDGQPGVKGGTVILSAEDGRADTIRPRLDAHGADCDRIIALAAIREPAQETGQLRDRLPDLTDLDHIRQAAAEVDAALLIIDPLTAYLPRGVDAFKDADVRRALAPLAALAELLGLAVVIVRHLRKTGGKAIYAGGGSIGIIGAARVGFIVADDPGDETRSVFAVSKVNIAVKSPALAYRLIPDDAHGCARVQWEGPVDLTADDLTVDRNNDDRDSDDADDIRGWLHAYLARNGGAAAPEDIVKAGGKAGYSPDQLKRAKKPKGTYPKVYSRKAGMDDGWVWSLEEGTDMEERAEGSTFPEGSTKGAKGAGSGNLLPSHPSVLPSGGPFPSEPCDEPCDGCGTAPTRVDRGGRRLCRSCGPHVWSVPV
jgi:hypothetical protein